MRASVLPELPECTRALRAYREARQSLTRQTLRRRSGLQENRFCVIVKQSAAAQQLLFYKERICLQAFRPKTRCPPASGHGLTAVCGRNEALYIQGEFRKRVMRETAWLSVFEKETVIQASGGTFYLCTVFSDCGETVGFSDSLFLLRGTCAAVMHDGRL